MSSFSKIKKICVFCKQYFSKGQMESWQENEKTPVEYICQNCWKKEIKK